MTTLPRPAVYLVTDRRQLTPDARTTTDELRALEAFLDSALDAGIDLIQIREADVDIAALTAFVRRVMSRAGDARARVLVNDRADVALAAGAHGVHLRADGPPISQVRSLVGSHVIGRSVHKGDDLDAHREADYLLFGTVFPSPSKPATQATGIAALVAAVSASAAPILAIGGMTPARAAECHQVGAAGVAAIGIFLPEGRTPEALGVRRAVRELRAAMDLSRH